VYLQDIYVLPEFRQAGHGVTLMNNVADIGREMGKKLLLGSVVPSTKFGNQMMQIMLQLGFKLHSSENDIVYLIKDIGSL
jgi:GNAT superfamily N-acetyltransferase